jgi:T5orf172 domain
LHDIFGDRSARGEMPDIIYVLVNEAMPGLIKIGRTNGESVEDRMRQLDVTGVPLSVRVLLCAEVEDADKVERALHTAFGDHRVRPRREFFRLSPDKPTAILRVLQKREVTPNVDVVGEPSDQEALDEAKKRAPLIRFSMIGMCKAAISVR